MDVLILLDNKEYLEDVESEEDKNEMAYEIVDQYPGVMKDFKDMLYFFPSGKSGISHGVRNV